MKVLSFVEGEPARVRWNGDHVSDTMDEGATVMVGQGVAWYGQVLGRVRGSGRTEVLNDDRQSLEYQRAAWREAGVS